MEQWELAARESIRDLATRYNSNGDAGRFAQVRTLFAADAVMELTDRLYIGIDEIMTIFSGTQQRLSGGAQPHYVRHFGATHQIDLIDKSHATGRLYFAVLSPVGLDHWGRYIDEYRIVEDVWKFARRKVIVDGQSPATIFPKV
jgi:SnoaL-like domain